MDVAGLLVDLFGRVDEHVEEVLDGLDPAWLTARVGEGTNPIGWLVWHLTRVQDAQVAELLGEPQLWEQGDWASGFGLDPDPANHGYGHTQTDVDRVRPASVELLRDHHRAVSARTRAYVAGLTAAELDRVVDERWDPPVTLGVRLISIADDDIQHAGQAAYLRGLLERGEAGSTT